MQRHHKKRHFGIFGESGTGKTTLGMKFITNAAGCTCCKPRIDAPTCVFLFDGEDEFSEVLGIPQVGRPQQMDRAVSTGWVCFDPSVMFAGRPDEALGFFCDYAMRVSDKIPGRKFLVLDELGKYVTGQNLPFDLKVAVQTGRRFGIDCVFMGQQLNELHNTIRNQLTELILFRTTDDNALDFAVRKFRFNPQELLVLPDHRWIARNKFGGETRG